MKKVLASILSVMMIATLSVSAQEEGVFTVSGNGYKTLQEAVNACSTDICTIEVNKSYNVEASTNTTIGASNNQQITLDLNRHTINVNEGFEGRYILIQSGSSLSVIGDGIMDFSNAGAGSYGPFDNYGHLYLNGLTIVGSTDPNSSGIQNRGGGEMLVDNVSISGYATSIKNNSGAKITINNCNLNSPWYPALENDGEALITGGMFVNTSCSSCDKDHWGYTIRNGLNNPNAKMILNGVAEDSIKVTGTQGGVANIGGHMDIYNGIYQTVNCPEKHGAVFYAGYFTGESYDNTTNIYGGTFTSEVRNAIQIGNDNSAPDSGAGEASMVNIEGGAFVGGGDTKTAVDVDDTENAKGAADITGGVFSSDPSAFVDTTTSPQANIGETNSQTFAVGQEFITQIVSENPSETLNVTNVPAGSSLTLPEKTSFKNETGGSITVNGVEVSDSEIKTIYEIEEGANQTWTGSGDLIIKGSGKDTDFDRVEVNGVVISKDNYNITKGSTIVMFKETYLSSLSNGTYNVTMYWTDGGFATTTFTISKKTSGGGNNGGSTVRPSRPAETEEDEDLPSSTAECQKKFGKDVVYSEDLKACVYKFMVVDTSVK